MYSKAKQTQTLNQLFLSTKLVLDIAHTPVVVESYRKWTDCVQFIPPSSNFAPRYFRKQLTDQALNIFMNNGNIKKWQSIYLANLASLQPANQAEFYYFAKC